MMNPINDQISGACKLTQHDVGYSSYLEGLTYEDKLALRAVLTRYVYYKQCVINEYLIADALTDTMPDLDASICVTIMTLEGISCAQAEELSEFIAVELGEE